MVSEVVEVKPKSVNYDNQATRLFNTCIRMLGGPRHLIEHRNLTWLPSLMEACYAILLREKANRTADEIAKELGLTKQTVRNILEADPEAVKQRLERKISASEFRDHVAGGLAKLAYEQIKTKRASKGCTSGRKRAGSK